ncbi:MAG: hypothetical protein HZC02_00905 [Candidatus Levybacteria bacterium]|nr:hypothetical protein [Candidatus Levybacteria bacterium]
MTEIAIRCCEGNERYKGECLKDRCPVYSQARREVDRSWPYVGTGFGNLYGNPEESTYLAQTRGLVASKKSEQ